jgi:hypothetical protein
MSDAEGAAVDKRTEDFLDVEATARSLADRLARLDAEALRYSSAATNLDQAAQATRELTTAVREIGDSVTRAIDVVASVGGPEIVARLDGVSEAIQTAEDQTAARHSELLGKMQLAVTLAGVAAALAGIATVVAFIR